MESYRQGHRLTVAARGRQAGITVLGFLLLAALFGVVGLAAIKLVPMYLQNMRLSTVLDDVERELSGQGTSPANIQRELDRRFAVEGINLPKDRVKITQGKSGYQVRIQYENRAVYMADLWLLVAFDKQVEIKR
jgi:hypothetical protein